MSQQAAVAAHLRRYGGITSASALGLGVAEVRKVIYELRQQGWRIATAEEPGGPEGHYILEQEPGQEPRQVGLGL